MKKSYYWPLGIIGLLIITNPSLKSFKEYTGVYNTVIESKVFSRREHNYFIFSIYSDSGSSDKYLGIAGNFIEIKSDK